MKAKLCFVWYKINPPLHHPGLLPWRRIGRHPHPLDAPGVHPAEQVHRRVGRLGLRGAHVGDIQSGHAAILRDESRRGEQQTTIALDDIRWEEIK